MLVLFSLALIQDATACKEVVAPSQVVVPLHFHFHLNVKITPWLKKKKSKKNKLEVGIAPCQRLGCECSPMHNLLKMKLRVLFTSALVCESSLVLLLRGNYSLDLIMCSLCTIVGPLEFTLREVFWESWCEWISYLYVCNEIKTIRGWYFNCVALSKGSYFGNEL